MEMSVIQFVFHLIHIKAFHARSPRASLLVEAAFVEQLLKREIWKKLPAGDGVQRCLLFAPLQLQQLV